MASVICDSMSTVNMTSDSRVKLLLCENYFLTDLHRCNRNLSNENVLCSLCNGSVNVLRLFIDCLGLHGVDHLCSCLGNYLLLFLVPLMLN